MATRELLLIAKAIDQVSGPLKSASGGVKEFGSQATKSDDQLSGMSSAAKLLGGVLAGAVTIQTAKAAYELGKLGAESLRTKANFAAISGGASSAADNLDAMRTATRRALSEQEMMTAANQMLQMGLVSTSDELEEVSGMATRLGSAMGKDAGESLEAFTLMLANQSIPRLDTFGISASAVRTEMANLAKEFPNMSKETRFMTATMNQGRAALERLGPAIEDDMLAAEQLEASMADLKVMAAEMLAPAMAAVAKTLVTATRAFQDQIREVDILTAAYGEEEVGLAMLNDRRQNSTEQMDALRERYEAVEAAVVSGATQIDGWSSSLMDSGEAIEGVTEAVVDYEGEIDLLVSAIKGPVKQVNEDYLEQLGDIEASIEEEAKTLVDLIDKHGLYDDAVIESQGKINELQGEVADLASAHREDVNRILYDIMLARLAVDGWTEDELRLATETARGMGIIDKATYDATVAMDTALAGFAAGDGVRETRLEIMGIADDILDLGPTAETAGLDIPVGLQKAEYGFDNIDSWAKDSAYWIDRIPRNVPIHTEYTSSGTPPVGPWTPGQSVPSGQFGIPYTQEGYAYLHEGEAVLTKEENRKGGRGGVVIHNNFGQGSVRSDADIRAIVNGIQRSIELQGLRGRIA